jgi:hypothetical protein
MKLKLKLDDLAVDSFDTIPMEKSKGTVFGEQCTCWTACGQNTCPGCPTCDGSCNDTCVASCNGTCNCPTNDTCGWSCDYSCMCNSNQPCPSAQYSACNGYDCL